MVGQGGIGLVGLLRSLLEAQSLQLDPRTLVAEQVQCEPTSLALDPERGTCRGPSWTEKAMTGKAARLPCLLMALS
jgi:hypothetical protein